MQNICLSKTWIAQLRECALDWKQLDTAVCAIYGSGIGGMLRPALARPMQQPESRYKAAEAKNSYLSADIRP